MWVNGTVGVGECGGVWVRGGVWVMWVNRTEGVGECGCVGKWDGGCGYGG